MIKIIISAYIAAVLLFAGFAEANTNISAEANTNIANAKLVNFQRLDGSTVYLGVNAANFDAQKEILTLNGHVSPECLSTIKPELNIDGNQVLVSITANDKDCLSLDGNYEVAIDLKAYIANIGLNQDANLHFVIDNFSGNKNSTFDYVAKKQVPYSFDTVLEGKIEMDGSGKIYLTSGRHAIRIFSRLDLTNYINNTVQIKGLIPSDLSIGDAIPTAEKLIVGQVIALR